MVKLTVSLFCRLQWKHIEFDVIADTKEIALANIDKEYPLEFRYKPYTDSNEDSLELSDEEESTFFILI